jgi:hypothetical protein
MTRDQYIAFVMTHTICRRGPPGAYLYAVCADAGLRVVGPWKRTKREAWNAGLAVLAVFSA